MTLDALIMLVGALVAIIPFMGFTVTMQQWILFILGIIVIGLGIAVRRRGKRVPPVSARKGEFVESVPASAVAYEKEARGTMHDPQSDKTAHATVTEDIDA